MKSPTRTVQMETTESEVIDVQIPAGSMDKPSDKAIGIVEGMYNPENWKFATIGFTTFDHELANDVAYALDWFTGGHEMESAEFGSIRVWSKGYYHYVGA